MRHTIEVADIFRSAGPAYRVAHAGHLSLSQLKVMSAIEACRTAALGGHVEACSDCGHQRIAYNSCRNRHCPRCQGAAARTWLEAQEANLLPVGYFHVVFTLPAQVADIAFHNAVYLAAGNPLIASSAQLHWQHIRRAMGAVLQRSALRETVWDEHEAIAAAIAAGRVAEAGRLMAAHGQRASDHMAQQLAAPTPMTSTGDTA